MVVAALLGLSALVGVVVGNRCFVCVPATGPWRDEAVQMFPDPMLCDHFNPQDKRYIRECPQTYPGCLTYKNGSRVLRMCSQQKEINDCKRANNVQYCLCSGDLCNGNASKQAPPDDEDQELPEGSGAGAGAANRDEHRPTTGSPPHGTTTEEPPHSCATSLLPALITIATSSIICVT